jgi:C-terminal domain 6 of the ABC-three component (ABC-3C) systems
MTSADFRDIAPAAAAAVPTGAQIAGGIPIPPVRLIQVLSPADWEQFCEEWLTYYKTVGTYASIRRYSGPGDLGLDVVAFTSENGFAAPWDGYQCKHYDHALEPGEVLGEVAKIIYHSFKKTPPFNQTFSVPRRHTFVAPQGVGITVGRWLKDPVRFKDEARKKWTSHCIPKIGKGIHAPLEGALLAYFNNFDFSIFADKTGVELIEEHSKTIFHAPRFGGGLPPRGKAPAPPAQPSPAESVYLKKLFDAYGEHVGNAVASETDLNAHPKLLGHYNRQRVLFYSAEELRNYARDRTPPQTFDSLQDDIYHGIIDVCESPHVSAFARLGATIATAGSVDVSGNALASVARVADKQGICHQLANDDRLTWTEDDE